MPLFQLLAPQSLPNPAPWCWSSRSAAPSWHKLCLDIRVAPDLCQARKPLRTATATESLFFEEQVLRERILKAGVVLVEVRRAQMAIKRTAATGDTGDEQIWFECESCFFQRLPLEVWTMFLAIHL